MLTMIIISVDEQWLFELSFSIFRFFFLFFVFLMNTNCFLNQGEKTPFPSQLRKEGREKEKKERLDRTGKVREDGEFLAFANMLQRVLVHF